MRRFLAALTVALLAILGVVSMPTAANAAAGDYELTLTGPESGTIELGDTYNYVATLQFEGVDSSNPATGAVLTTTLPEGTTFTSVPSGPGQTVASYTYDEATRVLTLTLNDTTESVVSIAYTVSQVENYKKYENFPLVTSMSGMGGPSGSVTSDEVTTLVTGDNDYDTSKRSTTIAGSDNRTVTYYFNIGTAHPNSNSTFTSYSQTLTDSLPAGAELVGASSTWNNGSWDTSAFPDVTWTRTGTYGPSQNQLDTSGQQIWITVHYPETVPGWELGQQPPLNTVDLATTDAKGTPHDGASASAQSIPFGPTGGVSVGATKSDAGQSSAGFLSHLTQTAGSYIGPGGSPDIDQLVLTDSGATGSPNESWFNHADIKQLFLTFSTSLQSLDLPYLLEYQIDGSSTWSTFTGFPTGNSGTTSQSLVIAVQTDGSTSWQSAATQGVLNLPVGSTLTGWRLTVAPGAETVPINVEAQVRMSFQPVFRGVDQGIASSDTPAATSPGAQTNTVTVEAGALTNTASHAYTPSDSVYITTHVDAPTALSVGGSGVVTAGIVNQNPSETYTDSTMSVVLPCGVLYDPSQPISIEPSTTGIPATPAIGAGATVDASGRVTGADGCEQQVVEFSFDSLPPMRPPGVANSRLAEAYGWTYAIPVTAIAQAYKPSETSVRTTSWATSADPRFLSTAAGGTNSATVPMTGYGPFFTADSYDFDPARGSIAFSPDITTINTAGGLLISKLSAASPTGPWGLNTTVGTEAYWQILVNDILPNPVTGSVFFDKLPSIADGDDFDTQLSGAVTGAPDGATVEYSTNATSATTGTWTSDPTGATAFRVSVASLTIGNTFTLVVPTTVLGDTSYGETADNTVSASGTYNGNAVAFSSNPAAVNVVASPSLSVVKKTNGIEYTEAPGALVAVGSTVTWTYDVTNTGDTPLGDVAVSDVFTAGDGSTGTLTPTSTVTGLLLPGETRTFTATGLAIEGQYQNTATAVGTAVDEEGEALPVQPTPAVDDSWYLAGDSGLSIVKTTNGEDVDSAPGLPLTPGDEVDWSYTVTNTGSLPLTDVLVEDYDHDGELVFSDTIPALAPGESVTLNASGTAIEGQYHNTVTATAEDPAGGETPLVAADDSWYFGVIPGLDIEKQVSKSASGPWSETVEVTTGDASYWQIVVTNTGNSTLTDVVVTDDELDETVEVGTLAAGESRTIPLTLDHTTRAFTNVAVATGVALDGSELDASDDASVTVVAAPVATPAPGSPSGLALTGLTITGALVAGAGLLLAGFVLVMRRRRTTEE
ncbi:hypothetical protein QCD70_13910 [Agreia sp. PsM10]|uniref:DUF7507 domain-containing protein n=1 Tax=Agreia sp. PsM10 TaxID=3030533 RepID=UPI00263ABE55|nr:hypothetical protein [Agreia sp. PsM10]MDN4641348.1 hypothetical protein [Agreia sp. PsM10]